MISKLQLDIGVSCTCQILKKFTWNRLNWKFENLSLHTTCKQLLQTHFFINIEKFSFRSFCQNFQPYTSGRDS